MICFMPPLQARSDTVNRRGVIILGSLLRGLFESR
jgi:hypothetical protein